MLLDLGPTLTQSDFISTSLITCAQALFPNKLTLKVLGMRIQTYLFEAPIPLSTPLLNPELPRSRNRILPTPPFHEH